MSLVSFAAEAGKKVIRDSMEAAGGKPVVNLSPEQNAAIMKHVQAYGLNVEHIAVTLNGPGEITITGDANSKADAEKLVLLAGNIIGITRVNNAIRVAAGAPEEKDAATHTVVKGDTLSAIAKKVYGDANKYPVIFEANRPMLKDADEIYPGQVLRIPALD